MLKKSGVYDDFRISACLNYNGYIGTIPNSDRCSHNVAIGLPNNNQYPNRICRGGLGGFGFFLIFGGELCKKMIRCLPRLDGPLLRQMRKKIISIQFGFLNPLCFAADHGKQAE